MEIDTFKLLLSAVIFFVYGGIFVISIIFTFFIDAYRKLDEKINLDIISAKILTPLEINIDVVDAWLIDHRKIVGPLLILLSLIDMLLIFDIINKL